MKPAGDYRRKRFLIFAHLLTLLCVSNHTFSAEPATAPEKPNPASAAITSETLSVTTHAIKIQGKSLPYKATAGFLLLTDEFDKRTADLFFCAYERDRCDNKDTRPLTFVFNGGPGASSAFLHLGALGPKRVPFREQGTELPEQVRLAPNDYSWLVFTDVVFVDPVGTGYSRAAPGVDAKQFYRMEEDTRILAEFIRRYITISARWLSPKFLVGESFGATRAAALAGYLQNTMNIHLRGLILISPAINFQTLRFDSGNDLPYMLFLPAYTAAALYHNRLAPDLQAKPEQARRQAEAWAMGAYAAALLKGDQLSPAERTHVIEQMASYTGISKAVIDYSNLRINQLRFAKELLRSQRRTLGILDSRVTGIDSDYASETSMFDPSLVLTTGPYTSGINHYLRTELKFSCDRPYTVLNLNVNREWNWGSTAQGYVNVSVPLREAMSHNPHLKLLIACGYYDLATPYFASQYTVDHLDLDPAVKDNLALVFYDAGHQIYTHLPSLQKMTGDVCAFVRKACE